MLEELQLFHDPQFDDSIHRVEVRTYHPFVKSFGNNDEIEITINQLDALLAMSEAAISIEGTLKKTAGTGTVQFTNNAGAYLFDSISYELNGVEMDRVRDPGTVSLVRGYLTYDKDDDTLSIAGWNFPEGQLVTYNPTTNTFYMRIPLRHLLGVFYDYKKYMYGGKQTIRLVRARTDTNCYKVSSNDTVVELNITNIDLKIKHVFVNDLLKLELLSEMNNDKPIFISYRQWSYYEIVLVDGAFTQTWPIKASSNAESPKGVFVTYQTNRKDNKLDDVTLFDNSNITNIKLYINSEYYPYENLQLDFPARKYSDVYHMYTEFCKTLAGNNRPMLDFVAFHNHAIFAIDCSKRNDSVKSSTIDIKLEFESKQPFPPNTRAYCILIHDRVMEYLPLSGIVRNGI